MRMTEYRRAEGIEYTTLISNGMLCLEYRIDLSVHLIENLE